MSTINPDGQETLGHDEDADSESVSVGSSSDAVPAMPDEEAEAMIEMTKLREMTVEPGVIRVPVEEVHTAHNSNQWVIEMDHPIEDDIRFFLPKPVHGWSDDYKLVRLLDWYGIADPDADVGGVNVYDLQVHDLYIEYDEYDDEWTLMRPPDARPRRTRLYNRVLSTMPSLPVIDREPVVMYVILVLGTTLTASVGQSFLSVAGSQFLAPGILVTIGLLISTLLGLLVTDP